MHFDQAVKSKIWNKSSKLSKKYPNQLWNIHKIVQMGELFPCCRKNWDVGWKLFKVSYKYSENHSQILCVVADKKWSLIYWVWKRVKVPCQVPIISVPFSPSHNSFSLLHALIWNNLSSNRNMLSLVHCPSLHSPMLVLEKSFYPCSVSQSHACKMTTCFLLGLKLQTGLISYVQ